MHASRSKSPPERGIMRAVDVQVFFCCTAVTTVVRTLSAILICG